MKGCNNVEIERKFLVTDLKEINLDIYEKEQIIQDYLYSDKFSTIRKRHIIKNDEHKYKYTIKTGKKKYSVNEIEKDITEEEYNDLKLNPNNKTINKIRYIIPYINDLKIELDIFKGEYEGIMFAEIEFKTEEDAENAKVPKWFGKELSGKVTNGMMARMDFDIIKEIISKI